MDRCYSRDNESFNFASQDDLFDAMAADGELVLGQAYYEADCKVITASAVIRASDVIEGLDERLGDLLGECYDNDLINATADAKRELESLLCAWAEKHASNRTYWLVTGMPQARQVTAADLSSAA